MNSYFVATYMDKDFKFRHAVGEKEKGITDREFLYDIGFNMIKQQPAKGLDSEGYFAPLIVNSFSPKNINKVNKTESKATQEDLASYLKEKGWTVYKRNNAKE